MKLQAKSIILAAAITALATPMIASAVVKTSNSESVSVPVSYSGYDLQSEAGKTMVERKIRQAAHKICGATTYSQLRSLKQISANKACFDDAVENAMNGLENFTAAN